ncbi:MAG: CooT family nickel-binding protein [Clostridiales bacterium]|nr:CooT family nickel-binding protein [Clostridiales bacterium]
MCISTVYKGTTPAPENILAEYITALSFGDGAVSVTDITGERTTLTGTITRIDLAAGKIFLDPS